MNPVRRHDRTTYPQAWAELAVYITTETCQTYSCDYFFLFVRRLRSSYKVPLSAQIMAVTAYVQR